MTNDFHNHLDADDAENYCLGRLPVAEVEPAEEHLLVCESCRHLVEEADAYVAAMRAAVEALGHRKSRSQAG